MSSMPEGLSASSGLWGLPTQGISRTNTPCDGKSIASPVNALVVSQRLPGNMTPSWIPAPAPTSKKPDCFMRAKSLGSMNDTSDSPFCSNATRVNSSGTANTLMDSIDAFLRQWS